MDNFFGSKLNSLLLIILILLMVLAIKIMLYNQDTYFPFLGHTQTEQTKPNEDMDRTKILGNKDDLVSFSIWPGSKVYGVVSYRGVIKNNYFFEANIGIAVADTNKKIILQDHANATTDWMTSGPVSFEGNINFSSLPKGPAYLVIQNDNPSGLPEHDKSVLIPIVIE